MTIVELKMARSEVHTKMTKVQYSSVWPGQSWLESTRKGYVYTNVGRVALIFETELTE